MAEHGVEVATTNVGDRYVLEALREREWSLGGEQSGHIIDRNFVPSGDGIAAALLTLEALGSTDLADRHAMEKLPQTLVNVKVRDRGALEHATAVHEAVEREVRGARGPRARPAAPERHRAARARDGRGADRRRGRQRVWAPRRARRDRTRVEQAWTGRPAKPWHSQPRLPGRRSLRDLEFRRKEDGPCAASSDTSDSGRCRRSSSPAWRSSSTAGTTPRASRSRASRASTSCAPSATSPR